MDTFENEEYQQTPEKTRETVEEPSPQQPYTNPYHGAGAGRKESPYANSPYEPYQPPRQEYQYQPQTEPPVKPKKVKKPRKPIGKKILAAVLALVLVAGSCIATASFMTYRFNNVVESMVQDHAEEINELRDQINGLNTNRGSGIAVPSDGSAMTPAQLYASQVNSVVAISTTIQSGYGSGQSSGSGFILTEDGYVITNYHVVEDATAIDVVMHDGTEYPAVLIGTDAQTDIAVIKVEAAGLTAAVLGDSDKLQVGEPTVVIGNPLGSLGGTVTNGIISALNRTITIDGQDMTVLQTNAAVNPGNSGGGMFNINGELIGIINAKSSGDAVEGLGFAIPINIAKDIADQLINYGYIKGRPQLGISVATIESANDYWTYRSTELAPYITDYGVYIIEWKNGDFQFGDRVIGFNGKTVSAFADIKAELANYAVGDTVIITVSRSNRITEVEVVLTEYVPQATESAE